MQIVNIDVESRELGSTGSLNGMRRDGWVPAVIYNEKEKRSERNVLVKLNEKIFLKSMAGHRASNVILELNLGGKSANVVIKEIQRNSTTDQLLHIDFKRISMTEKLEVSVPVHLSGEAPGVKLHGGILEHLARELRVLCLPKDIPNVINVDSSSMEVGQHINVKDLPAIEGVEIVTSGDHLVVHVVSHAVEEEPAAAAAAPGTATSPEVIAKGKKPEEGEAAGAAKGAAPAAAKPAAKK